METTEKVYVTYPFSYDGYDFVSRVLVGSNIYQRVQQVSEATFIQINQECLQELMGPWFSLEEVKLKLIELNDNSGGNAYIELAQA